MKHQIALNTRSIDRTQAKARTATQTAWPRIGSSVEFWKNRNWVNKANECDGDFVECDRRPSSARSDLLRARSSSRSSHSSTGNKRWSDLGNEYRVNAIAEARADVEVRSFDEDAADAAAAADAADKVLLATMNGQRRLNKEAPSSSSTTSSYSSRDEKETSNSNEERRSRRSRGAKIIKTDYLVVGSGIAGLSYALEAAAYGKVAIVTKANAQEASTAYAQGGISAVISAFDSIEEHVKDTIVAGDYLCDDKAVRALCEDGRAAIERLCEIGTRFTKAEELRESTNNKSYQGLHLCREGGHGKPRIVHCDDMTGKEVERALVEATRNHPNVTFYEHHVCVDLMTSNERCIGASAVSTQTHAQATKQTSSQIVRFYAATTLLACGGAGQLFPSTTNPVVCTGDGIGMAARANVLCENLEFVQFHPTALYADDDIKKSPAKKMDENENAFLITEAVRGHGGELWTHLEGGERFMPEYDDRNELAPRDVVARAIHAEMRKNNSPCVYLDITKKDAEDVQKNFPGIYKELMKRNLDMTKQRIPVRPAAHYLCGGVKTNIDGETSLTGLFACGEVACTGVHGANRLASNSLLEGVVFARRAVKTAEKKSRESLKQMLEDEFESIVDEDDFLKYPNDIRAEIEQNFLSTNDAFASSLRKEVQLSMWRSCGIVRRTDDMRETLMKFKALQRLIDEEEEEQRTVTLALVEAKNLLAVGTLVLRSALRRKESRGLHYVVEYPDRVEEERVSTILAFADNEDDDLFEEESITRSRDATITNGTYQQEQKIIEVARGPR